MEKHIYSCSGKGKELCAITERVWG